MKLHVYGVLDKAVGAFAPPFFCRSRGEAVRIFRDACGDQKSPLGKYPDDYVLYSCGVFDDNAGMFDRVEPVRVIGAREVLELVTSSADEQSADRPLFADLSQASAENVNRLREQLAHQVNGPATPADLAEELRKQ